MILKKNIDWNEIMLWFIIIIVVRKQNAKHPHTWDFFSFITSKSEWYKQPYLIIFLTEWSQKVHTFVWLDVDVQVNSILCVTTKKILSIDEKTNIKYSIVNWRWKKEAFGLQRFKFDWRQGIFYSPNWSIYLRKKNYELLILKTGYYTCCV